MRSVHAEQVFEPVCGNVRAAVNDVKIKGAGLRLHTSDPDRVRRENFNDAFSSAFTAGQACTPPRLKGFSRD